MGRSVEDLQRQAQGTLPIGRSVTRTYAAKISVRNADAAIKLGMTANVYLPGCSGLSQSCCRPPHCFRITGTRLWVVDKANSQVKLVPVEVNEYVEDRVGILAGLLRGTRSCAPACASSSPEKCACRRNRHRGCEVRHFNLSEWAFGHQSLAFLLALFAAGLFSYFRLDQAEGPISLSAHGGKGVWPSASQPRWSSGSRSAAERGLWMLSSSLNPAPRFSVLRIGRKGSGRVWYQSGRK